MTDAAAVDDGMNGSDLPVVVFAPYGDDAAAIGRWLGIEGAGTVICPDAGALRGALDENVGAVLLSQEGLTHNSVAVLSEFLAAQETWSELPVIVLLDKGLQAPEVLSRLQRQLRRAKLITLQRPVRQIELTTIVHSALRGRRRQFAVRGHISYQEELGRELNHRVKNVLATVQALFEMTRRNSGDLESFAREFRGRLQALSGVHTALHVDGYQTALLREVIANVVQPFQTVDQRIRCDGPDLRLEPDAATMLALALHELVTNAAKYGALSNDDGRIDLTWGLVDHGAFLRFDWIESGGPAVNPPSRKGYGTTFIRSVFGGRFDGTADLNFAPAGLRAALALASRKALLD